MTGKIKVFKKYLRYQSHFHILEQAVSRGIENDDDVLINDKLQPAYAPTPARANSTQELILAL
jgi:hypothetical protein